MNRKAAIGQLIVMIAGVVITGFTLSRYALLVQSMLRIKYSWLFETGMVAGAIVFQYLWIRKLNPGVQRNYFFGMLMVSLIGAVMLWPLLQYHSMYGTNNWINIGYFFTVVLFMFVIHKKMVAGLRLPALLSYTWILYRFIILFFIL